MTPAVAQAAAHQRGRHAHDLPQRDDLGHEYFMARIDGAAADQRVERDGGRAGQHGAGGDQPDNQPVNE